jgi:hypothetical protein
MSKPQGKRLSPATTNKHQEKVMGRPVLRDVDV